MTSPLTPSERQRLRSPAYLLRALIPLLVIVGLTVLLVWPRGDHPDGVHVVDITGPIAAARQQVGFDILVPTTLDARWRPNHTDLVPSGPANAASFTIGYVSPSGQYAEFLESSDRPEAVAAQYGPLSGDGGIPVRGAEWERFRTTKGRELLRHTTAGVTVIVTGTAPSAELVQLAEALR